jgi:DNA polymerase V
MSSPDDPDGIVRIGRDPASSAQAPRASVAIGFGSPSQDSGVARLDLNEVLVRHAQASFMMRAAGDAMREAGIDNDDLLLIDRAIAPTHGHVVIASVEGEFVCRRLIKQGGRLLLQAACADVADIVPDDGNDLQVWGVVTHVIKTLPA